MSAASTRQGIWLCIAAMAFFATLDTLSKYVSTLVSLSVAIWMRFLVQAVVAGAVVLPTRGAAVWRLAHPWLQLLRGTLGLASSTMGFFALQTMAVAEFTAILMLIPMTITLISAARLGERVPPRGWLLLLGGLVGALLVIRPGATRFQWGMLLSLGCVACSSVFQLLTSYLSKDDDPQAMHFYTGVVATVLAALALPFFWRTPDSGFLWFLMVMVGVCSTVGHYLLILAYTHVRPSVLTPYLYFQIAFATLAGWLVFSRVPDRYSLIGILVITACGLASTWVNLKRQVKTIPAEPTF